MRSSAGAPTFSLKTRPPPSDVCDRGFWVEVSNTDRLDHIRAELTTHERIYRLVPGTDFVASPPQYATPGDEVGIVSKRVTELEHRLGARLIARTSRQFSVTDLGREVYQHAKAMFAEAEAAAFAVERQRSEPIGLVRLTASATTCQSG